MNVDLEKVLKSSPDAMKSRTNLKSVLKDLYPEEKRDINILLDVFESGAPSKIAEKKYIDDHEYNQFIVKIADDYGMQEICAKEALDEWIDVFLGAGTSKTLKVYDSTIPVTTVNPVNNTTGKKKINKKTIIAILLVLWAISYILQACNMINKTNKPSTDNSVVEGKVDQVIT